MPTDQRGEPWPDRTYNGFSGPAAEPRRRTLPRVTGRAVAIGGAAAIALGLVLGVWARPNFGKDPTDAAERTATPVPIEVNRPPPPQPLTSNGKLEVLSPEEAAQARAANAAAYPPPPAPASTYVPAPPPPLPSVAASPGYAPAPTYRAPPVAPPMVRQPPPLAPVAQDGRPGRAGFDCGAARSQAEAMVCGDPDLAAADREMTRAYRRALQSGAAPPQALRQEQRDFLAIREDAARHSRRALAQVYQQRIDDLNDLADRGGPDD